MSSLESSATNPVPGPVKSVADPLALYHKYGAVAYGIILRILPQPDVAQEVLLNMFTSPDLLAGLDHFPNPSLHIIQVARRKALEVQRENAAVKPRLPLVTEDSSPARIFELAFNQGYSPDEIARQLGLTKAEVLMAIREHIRTYRQP